MKLRQRLLQGNNYGGGYVPGPGVMASIVVAPTTMSLTVASPTGTFTATPKNISGQTITNTTYGYSSDPTVTAVNKTTKVATRLFDGVVNLYAQDTDPNPDNEPQYDPTVAGHTLRAKDGFDSYTDTTDWGAITHPVAGRVYPDPSPAVGDGAVTAYVEIVSPSLNALTGNAARANVPYVAASQSGNTQLKVVPLVSPNASDTHYVTYLGKTSAGVDSAIKWFQMWYHGIRVQWSTHNPTGTHTPTNTKTMWSAVPGATELPETEQPIGPYYADINLNASVARYTYGVKFHTLNAGTMAITVQNANVVFGSDQAGVLTANVSRIVLPGGVCGTAEFLVKTFDGHFTGTLERQANITGATSFSGTAPITVTQCTAVFSTSQTGIVTNGSKLSIDYPYFGWYTVSSLGGGGTTCTLDRGSTSYGVGYDRDLSGLLFSSYGDGFMRMWVKADVTASGPAIKVVDCSAAAVGITPTGGDKTWCTTGSVYALPIASGAITECRFIGDQSSPIGYMAWDFFLDNFVWWTVT